jgi:hypothetical protein
VRKGPKAIAVREAHWDPLVVQDPGGYAANAVLRGNVAKKDLKVNADQLANQDVVGLKVIRANVAEKVIVELQDPKGIVEELDQLDHAENVVKPVPVEKLEMMARMVAKVILEREGLVDQKENVVKLVHAVKLDMLERTVAKVKMEREGLKENVVRKAVRESGDLLVRVENKGNAGKEDLLDARERRVHVVNKDPLDARGRLVQEVKKDPLAEMVKMLCIVLCMDSFMIMAAIALNQKQHLNLVNLVNMMELILVKMILQSSSEDLVYTLSLIV